MINAIKTIREANTIAKKLGLSRGKGSYNGKPYWLDSLGRIVTRERLAELTRLY